MPYAAQYPTAAFRTNHCDLRSAEADDLTAVRRFLHLKAQRAAIDEELDCLKPQLTSLVLDQPDEPVAEAYGFTLRVYRRRTYRYSDQIKQMSQELKAARKLEEAQGIAVLTKEAAVLSVTPSKR